MLTFARLSEAASRSRSAAGIPPSTTWMESFRPGASRSTSEVSITASGIMYGSFAAQATTIGSVSECDEPAIVTVQRLSAGFPFAPADLASGPLVAQYGRGRASSPAPPGSAVEHLEVVHVPVPGADVPAFAFFTRSRSFSKIGATPGSTVTVA